MCIKQLTGQRAVKREETNNRAETMSYDFAFGHPIVYEEPKVPELEKTIETLREELKNYKRLYKSQVKLVSHLRPFQKKAQTQEAIFDDYIAEKKTLKDTINDLQAENEKLKALLSA